MRFVSAVCRIVLRLTDFEVDSKGVNRCERTFAVVTMLLNRTCCFPTMLKL